MARRAGAAFFAVLAGLVLAFSGFGQEESEELSIKARRLLEEWGRLVGSALSLEPESLEALSEELTTSGERLERAKAHLEIPEEDIYRLKTLLAKRNEVTRDETAEVLHLLRRQVVSAGKYATLTVLPYVTHENRDVRLNAAIALAETGDVLAMKTLQKNMRAQEQKDEAVRYWSVKAMVHYQEYDVADDLVKVALEDPSEIVRSIAIQTLGQLRVKNVAKKFLSLLGPEIPDKVKLIAGQTVEAVTGEKFGFDTATTKAELESTVEKCIKYLEAL